MLSSDQTTVKPLAPAPDLEENRADGPKANRAKEVHVSALTGPHPGAESAAARLASGRSAAVLAERAIPSPMPSATVDIRTDGRKRRE